MPHGLRGIVRKQATRENTANVTQPRCGRPYRPGPSNVTRRRAGSVVVHGWHHPPRFDPHRYRRNQTSVQRAVMDGRIARNAADGARLPRIQRREAAFLEPQHVGQIAREMRPPYGLFVRLLGQLGPRFGEAAAIRRRSVDLLRRRILISESLAEVNGKHVFGPTKTHAARRIPLTSSLADALTNISSSSLRIPPPWSSRRRRALPCGTAISGHGSGCRCWSGPGCRPSACTFYATPRRRA